jgi:hypothetical protein
LKSASVARFQERVTGAAAAGRSLRENVAIDQILVVVKPPVSKPGSVEDERTSRRDSHFQLQDLAGGLRPVYDFINRDE